MKTPACRPRSRHDRRRSAPIGRTLHLLDLENLCGDPMAGYSVIAAAIDAYRRTVAVRADDIVIVGCNGGMVLAAAEAWPTARIVKGVGPDGVDLRLLGDAEPHMVSARFDRVVIGSGDHIFAPLASALRARRTAVVVVSLAGSLSAQLRWAAGLVKELPAPALV